MLDSSYINTLIQPRCGPQIKYLVPTHLSLQFALGKHKWIRAINSNKQGKQHGYLIANNSKEFKIQ